MLERGSNHLLATQHLRPACRFKPNSFMNKFQPDKNPIFDAAYQKHVSKSATLIMSLQHITNLASVTYQKFIGFVVFVFE
jgi:hypothetical protein